jgi:hypothetical protein
LTVQWVKFTEISQDFHKSGNHVAMAVLRENLLKYHVTILIHLSLFQILDVVALECCLQQLEPKPEDLQNAENRLIWCNRVQSIRPTVQVMKTFISRPAQQQNTGGNSEEIFHDQLFGDQSARILHNCRCVFILASSGK